MAFPLAAVITLSVCLPALAIAMFTYYIVRYQDRRKNEGLEEGINWDLWLVPHHDSATSEADLVQSVTAQQSSKSDDIGSIPLKKLPAAPPSDINVSPIPLDTPLA
ncbi:hypothetical protein B0J13DRAFT_605017 [Dactylonectria estremocensis]|uniref:Uncharacterized protein n=1 Tax=Dactylonectria estremocensis TaxID=1079267 RepID=A0A9P9F448_9HYPO|nr:hypothetical protein B0J13DRAFT_605017 [Dactylonectria estremocensis]